EAGHALFLDCRDLSTRQIPFDLDAEGLRLLVIDTRVSHSHSESGYGDRRRTCEEAAGIFGVESLRELDEAVDLDPLTDEQRKRVRHVLNENARVRATVDHLEGSGAQADRRIRGIGELLLSSHASLAEDYEVSCPELDTAVEAAMEAGAIGARMIGGGFGGSAIALIDAANADRVGDAVIAAFAARGYRAPDVFAVSAGTGASRIDGRGDHGTKLTTVTSAMATARMPPWHERDRHGTDAATARSWSRHEHGRDTSGAAAASGRSCPEDRSGRSRSGTRSRAQPPVPSVSSEPSGSMVCVSSMRSGRTLAQPMKTIAATMRPIPVQRFASIPPVRRASSGVKPTRPANTRMIPKIASSTPMKLRMSKAPAVWGCSFVSFIVLTSSFTRRSR